MLHNAKISTAFYIPPVVKEAMEYKLERLNTTLIRSIYNTPMYNRLMYCPGTQI